MTASAFHSSATNALLLLLTLWLAGCTQSSVNNRILIENRQAAFDSWHRCLEHGKDAEAGLGRSTKLFRQRMLECQGHRNDLLATYPRHLESSVNRMLVVSARRALVDQSNASENEKSAARELARALPVRDDWSGILESGEFPGFSKTY